MSKSTDHVKQHKVIYGIIAALGVGGGTTATLTDNLPVSQGTYNLHVVAFEVLEASASEIKGNVDALLLNQLRASLRQAYKDRCDTADPQAINYINQEIEDLQDQYIDIKGQRFEPPPCSNA